MPQRFIGKKIRMKYVRPRLNNVVRRYDIPTIEEKPIEQAIENKENNIDTTMDTRVEKVEQIMNIAPEKAPKRKAKTLRKSDGIYERTEESTILLTEDNKMVLHD